MQRKGNSSYKSIKHPQCSNYGRNHSSCCFGIKRAYYTFVKLVYIAKLYPKANSSIGQATSHVQRNIMSVQA